jgi:hypothetical protein
MTVYFLDVYCYYFGLVKRRKSKDKLAEWLANSNVYGD